MEHYEILNAGYINKRIGYPGISGSASRDTIEDVLIVVERYLKEGVRSIIIVNTTEEMQEIANST